MYTFCILAMSNLANCQSWTFRHSATFQSWLADLGHPHLANCCSWLCRSWPCQSWQCRNTAIVPWQLSLRRTSGCYGFSHSVGLQYCSTESVPQQLLLLHRIPQCLRGSLLHCRRSAAAPTQGTTIVAPEREELSFVAYSTFVTWPEGCRSAVGTAVKVHGIPIHPIRTPLVLVVCLQHLAVRRLCIDRFEKVPDCTHIKHDE